MNWWQRFKRSHAHTQANIVCTIIIAAAAVAYAVIAGCQLGAMRGQLREISSQLPELKESAKAAKDSAGTASRQLTLQPQQMKLDRRAWVGLKDVTCGSCTFIIGGPKVPGETIFDAIRHLRASISVSRLGRVSILRPVMRHRQTQNHPD